MPKGRFTRGRKRNWTAGELAEAEDMIERGLSEQVIAGRLGRSENGVHVYLGRHGRSRVALRPLSATRIARLLGLGSAKTVSRWIQAGWLASRRGHWQGPNRVWWTSEQDLQAFLEDSRHWQRWDPDRITDKWLRIWAQELRAGERFLSVGQAAERLGVDGRLLNKWLRSGRITGVRNGNWFVAESALATFSPPRRLRHWTHDEVALALNLRCQDLSFTQIGKRIGRHPETVGQRVRLALSKRPLWRAVWHVVQEFGGQAAILDVARVLDDRGVFPCDHADIYGAVRDAARGCPSLSVADGVLKANRPRWRRSEFRKEMEKAT